MCFFKAILKINVVENLLKHFRISNNLQTNFNIKDVFSPKIKTFSLNIYVNQNILSLETFINFIFIGCRLSILYESKLRVERQNL